MGNPLVKDYRGVSSGDSAVLWSGIRVTIGKIELLTIEGASYGINAIYTTDGVRIEPREIERYEKPTDVVKAS